MLELFSTPIESTIVSRKEGYSICAFPKERPPLVGIMLFRMSILKDVLVGKDARWEWIDPDVGLLAVRQGHQRFAFVPAVVYHHSYLRIGLLSRKIRRDVTQTFLPYVSTRLTTYLNFGNSREVAEYFAWVVYANTFLPEFVRGVLNSIRVRDWACVYRPLVAVMVADLPIIIAVTRPEGRHFIRQVVRSWVTSHRARKRRGMNATGKRLRPLL